MRQFIKENPALAFGLGLPLLVVAVFLVAAGIPSMMVPPPKYDAVFATNYYDTNNGGPGIRIRLQNGKARVTLMGECNYCQIPEIYLYRAATKSIRKIPIDIPPEGRPSNKNGEPNEALKNRVLNISVPDIEQLKLDDSNPSPDGYVFDITSGNYSSGGILPSLFFSRSGYNEPVLRKDGYRYRLPMGKGYYNYYNVHFIGWVQP